VHVVAQIGRNEIVARHGVVGQIARKFRIGPDVVGAVRGVEVDVVEIDERIVVGRVESVAGRGVGCAADAFLVRCLRDARFLKLNDEMVGGGEVVCGRILAVIDVPIGA